MAVTEDDVHSVGERVGLTALLYYPEIHVDDADYDLAEQAAWCLEPVSGELSDDVRHALAELVARTVVDPTQYRQEMFTTLMELNPAE